ncbi:MAG: hypothetical protein JW841_16420 [Deltaproteobacteria bacterium]|nr:hypothetical protein [Deltaproteobacteria bacterium]
MAMSGAMIIAANLLSGLGLIAGIAITLVFAALFSSYLYFVRELVLGGKASINELSRSFKLYFWDIINLGFVVWILELLVGLLVARSSQGVVILAFLHFAEFVLLNAAPEIIYVHHTYGGLATVQRSIRFIHENWIEWFFPNLIVAAIFYFGLPILWSSGLPVVLISLTVGVIFHFSFVFRGCLFIELDSSSHRQRMHKYRTLKS